MKHRAPLVLLLLVAVLSSACSFGAPETPAEADNAPAANNAVPAAQSDASAGAVTITFAAYEWERPQYEPIIAAFNAEQSDVRVQFVSLDSLQADDSEEFDYNRWMRRLVSTADTVTSWGVDDEAVQQGLVYDLKPFIDADTAFDPSDFFPDALREVEGRVSMIPRTLRVNLLSYNKDLWAERGLTPPTLDWTWDDMISAAAQIARKNGDEVEVYGMLSMHGGTTQLTRELETAGVDIYSQREQPIRLDDPQVVAAMERVRVLFDSGTIYAPPSRADGAFYSDDWVPLIRSERVGIWGSDDLWTDPGQSLPFEIGTAVYPSTGPTDSNFSADGYIMSGGTQHPEAAWRWLSYLSRQTITRNDFDSISSVPARRSVADSSGYWSSMDEETMNVVNAVLERGNTASERSPSAWDTTTSAFLSGLYDAQTVVLSGEKEPAEALRDAQAAMEERLAQTATEPSPTPDTSPIVVATPQPGVVASAEATRITFGTQNYGLKDIRQVANAFNEANPDLFVEITTLDFSGMVSLPDVAEQADCFLWWGLGQDEEAASVIDLQPFMDADANFPRDEYAPVMLEGFRRDGRLYGLPLGASFQVLFYNQDAFDDAGLSYPNAAWTLDDMISAAEQLSSGSGTSQRYGFAGADPNTMFLFLSRLDASPISGSGETANPDFTNPAFVQAVRTYLDVLARTTPHKRFVGYSADGPYSDQEDAIGNGRVGMWFAYSNEVFYNSGAGAFTRGIAPMPLGGRGLSANDFWSNALFISSQAQHPEACWRWISHLSGTPNLLEDSFPARRSLLESFAQDSGRTELAEVTSAYSALLAQSSGTAQTTPGWYASRIDFFWLFRAVDNAIQGGDLQRELETAQAITEQYVACVRADGKAHDCAKQADPDYGGWSRNEE